MADIKDILNKIQKLNEYTTVKLPSSNQEVQIKQMSIKQQKDLKTIPENITLAMVSVNKEINDIIRSNCNLPLEQINIIDRIIIMIAFKSQISQTYKDYNIKDILNQSLQYTYNIKPETSKTKHFIFEYNTPNLKKDQEINKYILKEYNKQITGDFNDENQLQLLASKTYNNILIPETCKFITDIRLITDEEETPTNWNNLSIHQQIQILESIPYYEIENVMKYIEKVRDEELKFMTYNVKSNDNKDKKITLEFNLDFFNL